MAEPISTGLAIASAAGALFGDGKGGGGGLFTPSKASLDNVSQAARVNSQTSPTTTVFGDFGSLSLIGGGGAPPRSIGFANDDLVIQPGNFGSPNPASGTPEVPALLIIGGVALAVYLIAKK